MNVVASLKIVKRAWRIGILAVALFTTLAVLTFGTVLAATNGTMISATNTLPRGAVFLNDGQGGHWWVSDGALGICRLDAQNIAGQPPFKANSCNGNAKAGGQIVVGTSPTPGTSYLYIADSASKSVHVVRFLFTPGAAGTAGNISSPLLMNVNNPTFVGGGSGGGRPVALALGAHLGGGQDLYVGYLKSGDIMRVPSVQLVANNQQNPPADKVGNTSDGKGVNAFVMFGNDLYIAEIGGLGLSKIPDPSGLTRAACTAAAPCAAVSSSPQASFFPGGLATDGTYIYIGHAPLTAPHSILRYNPADGSVVIYSDAVPAYVSAFDGQTRTQYAGPFGLGINPANGDLYVGDDPTFLMAVPPLQQGHFWKVAAAVVAPTVTSIAPTSGPTTGGTVVTITGTGFSTAVGGTTISFGANAGTAVVCASVTSCAATSPAGSGVVDVIASVGGQLSAVSAADQFTYNIVNVNTVAISSVTPNTGVPTGGTLVTIVGTNFVPGGTTVNFGANAATNVNCTSATTCTAISPAGAGVVDVALTDVNGTSAPVAADRFTYITPVASLYAWGVTAPKGGAVWLPGAAAGSGHWWSSDHSQGLCRQDPVPGTTLRAINFAVCASDLVGSAGQAVYDPRANANGTHYVYVPDNAVKSTAVWRLTFNPATETMVVDPFDGVTLATAMIPLADLRTLKPNGMAIGPDGNLYVTDLVESFVRKITGPNGDPRLQTIAIIAKTGDGKGANGTQGFIGNLLYVSGNRATQFIDVTNLQCQGVPNVLPVAPGAVCGMASVPAPTGVFVAGSAVDAPHKLVYLSDSPGGANAVIHRYDASKDVYVYFASDSVAADLNGVVTCPGCTVGAVAKLFLTGGIFPAAGTPNATVFCALTCTRPWDFGNHAGGPGSAATFSFVFGLGMAPDGTLAITEDPSAGARAGRGTMWTVPYIP